jgi:hypothetical protein
MAGKAYGVVLKDDGSFLMATMKKTAGGWHLEKTSSWESTNGIKNNLLLFRALIAGVPCHYTPAEPQKVDSEDKTANTGATPRRFTEHENEAHGAVFTHHLSGNMISVVPDDVFLCTLPQALADPSVRSFVSAYRAGSFYKIGIIADGRLIVVFPMAPAGDEALESHLFRIERYLKSFAPEISFPRHVYLLGTTPRFSSTRYTVRQVDLRLPSNKEADEDTLKAAGAALASGTAEVYHSPQATDLSVFRYINSSLYVLSAALLILAVSFAGGLAVSGAVSQHRLDSYKARYQMILSENARVRLLMNSNDSLARVVLHATELVSKQTRWAQFLDLLAAIRPSDLYFDKFGSESVNPGQGTVRVALSGWSKNESLVTDVISSLQKSGMAADISLASMERDDSGRVTLFRILCTVKLFAS